MTDTTADTFPVGEVYRRLVATLFSLSGRSFGTSSPA
jgi:hypothetical protein